MKLTLDPRFKLLILVLINAIVFITPDLPTEWLCVFIIACILIMMGVYKPCFRFLVGYVGMMALLYLCKYLPDVLSTILTVSIVCIRKVFPTAMFAVGIIVTTKVSELICALQRLRMPKFIVIPMAIIFRFFPTAKEEFAHIRDARKLRGVAFTVRNIFSRPLIVLWSSAVPMMISAANIAEELSAASITRGIDSKNRRTSLYEPRIHAADFAVAVVFVALCIFSLMGGMKSIYG